MDLGTTPDSLIQDFRRIARTDLGYNILRIPQFVTPPDEPRGLLKENLSFGYPSRQTLGWC